jgi:esterase/lipase
MKNMKITTRIDKVYNPVLFVSCRDDDCIDPGMTEELYAKCASESKELLLFDDGGHAGAYPLHREEYEKAVKKLLKL